MSSPQRVWYIVPLNFKVKIFYITGKCLDSRKDKDMAEGNGNKGH